MILDCDPGLDDAIAIAAALGDPTIELLALTTVCGNLPLSMTDRNARAVLDFFAADVPVFTGADRPLRREPVHAPAFHGDDGLAGVVLAPAPGFDPALRAIPAPDAPTPETAAEAIVRLTAERPGEIHLVAVGPLTNIALALTIDPALPERVASFTIMGGSAVRGNITPAAEFNVYADPEAASAVFAAGWTVRMAGLDVTMAARGTAPRLARLFAEAPAAEIFFRPLLEFVNVASDDPATSPTAHDACAVLSVPHPELFGMVPARVEVETEGTWTSGMTVTRFDAEQPNAEVFLTVDADAFWSAMTDRLLTADHARAAHH